MSQIASGLISGSIIAIDLTKTPNEIPLIDAAVYDFEVSDLKVEENQDKTGYNLVAELKIVSEGPNKGRTTRDYMGISSDPAKNVRIRHFTLCALGTIPSPLNIDDMKGKIVRGEVVHRPDKKDTTKIYANVKDYIVPPEILAANPVQK